MLLCLWKRIGPQIEFLENMSDASDADSFSDRGSENGVNDDGEANGGSGCGSDSTESSHSTSVSEEAAECGRRIECCVGSLFCLYRADGGVRFSS